MACRWQSKAFHTHAHVILGKFVLGRGGETRRHLVGTAVWGESRAYLQNNDLHSSRNNAQALNERASSASLWRTDDSKRGPAIRERSRSCSARNRLEVNFCRQDLHINHMFSRVRTVSSSWLSSFHFDAAKHSHCSRLRYRPRAVL